MKKLLTVLATALAVAVSQLATATEYFVDITRPDDSGDGLTTNTAFKTIQTAVSRAANDDIVTVLPGEYAETPVSVTDGDSTTRSSLSRLYIDKRITLRSLEGAAKTHIVGLYSAKAPTHATYADGMGADAARCISVDNDKAAGTIIEGFTIRDGASGSQDANGADVKSGSQDGSRNRAGGVNTTKTVPNLAGTVYTVVDCVVLNCVGTRGGGLYGGKAVRTLFAFNRAMNYGAAGRQIAAYNCVFTHNLRAVGSANNSAGVVAYAYELVNCTFIDNADTFLLAQPAGNAYNCLFVNNGYSLCDVSGYSSRFFNCVTPDNAVTTGGTNCKSANSYEVINPLVDDFRLAHNAAAIGAGNAEYLTKIPEAYRATDFNGKDRLTDGVLNVGAVQGSATVLGVIKLPNSAEDLENGYFSMNGRLVRYTGLYCCATKPHELLRVSVVPTDETYAIRNCLLDTTTVWPMLDESVVFAYPTGTTPLNAKIRCRKIFWADPKAPNDLGDGSKDHPLRTIQAAVDKSLAASSGVIYAKEGDYDEGGYYNASYGVTSRIYVASASSVRVKAVGDRAKTVVWGASDSKSADGSGCGPAAVRCVLFVSSSPCLIQGFTLKGGRTAYSSTYSDGDSVRGACLYGGNEKTRPAYAVDCVLTDGCAGRGAAAFGCTLCRCIVTNNVVAGTGNSIFRTGYAYSCLFVDNDAKSQVIIGQGGYAFNCTLIGNKMDTTGNYRYAVGSTDEKQYNCVFGNAANALGTYQDPSTGFDCLSNQGSVSANSVKDDPCFADEENRDARILGCSAGVKLARIDRDGYTYDAKSAYDVTGKLFPIDEDGRFMVGCYADLVPGYRALATYENGISPVGAVRVTAAGSVTFTATADRPLLRFELNGEDVGYALNPDGKGTYTLSYDPAQGSGWIVKAVYGADWYVSPTGSDNNNGWSRETPFKTLKYATSKTAEGDTVHAARGTYDAGEFAQGDDGRYTPFTGIKTKSRVFVPAGRSLVSDEGAAVTFIKGHDDPGHRSDNHGLGPNALRCALLAQNALLKGFTLVDGCTDGQNVEDNDNRGGGVLAYNATVQIQDCVFTNCASYRGGGILGGTVSRCRFVGNYSVSMGAGSRDAVLYDSYFDGNVGACIAYAPFVERCTFGPNNFKEDGQRPIVCFAAIGSGRALVQDCLFADGGLVQTYHATNCVFQSASQLTSMVGDSYWRDGKDAASIAAAKLVAWDGSTIVDESGRPVKGCPAVDKLQLSSVPSDVPATDAYGEQRIFNNALDIGAFDHDWRPDYSRQIARSSAFAVTSAPPACVSTADGVLLLDGLVRAAWGRSPDERSFELKVRVTGAGTLTILKDGEPWKTVTVQDGEQDITYSSANHGLDFAYAKAANDADDVGALILGAKRLSGLILVVQ